jgi:alpha-N-arabinofuranosidase
VVHADRVTSASLAQLVNVIAPIMTEPGGAAWRQTTFFPFALTSRLAKGSALDVRLTGDTHQTEVYGEVNTVDAVATHDETTGRTSVFLVNRSQTEDAAITIDLAALGGVSVIEAQTLTDSDVNAKNTLEDTERVGLAANTTAVASNGSVTITLPPVSWTALELG